mgnify:FL=1|jgi:uncharacterized protein
MEIALHPLSIGNPVSQPRPFSLTLSGLILAASIATSPALAQVPGDDVNLRPNPAVACHVGLYRLADGGWVDVAPLPEAGLRWRRLDGSSGRMTLSADGLWISTLGGTRRVEGPQPQLGACGENRIVFEGRAGRRISQQVQDVVFTGHGGTRLTGRLILPPGAGSAPIIVEVHGSEGANALDFNVFQRLAPASGVGVFVYAKRGSGGSEGRYTQDFDILADDAAAAVTEARRLAGRRAGRVGLHGGSQAGWVAPLAASRTPVDFVIVDYGLAYSPLTQESDLVAQGLKARGWGPDVLAQARDITDAMGAFVASNSAVGYEGLDAVRARYGAAPWFADVKGGFTGMLLNATNDQIRAILPQYDVGTSWTYDPLPVLSGLNAPMLWILAGEDAKAPPEATRQRLIDLSARGRPITVMQYPGTDHGLTRFETAPDGARTSLGNPPGYFQAVLDWARTGRLSGDYGDGQVLACARGRRSDCSRGR